MQLTLLAWISGSEDMKRLAEVACRTKYICNELSDHCVFLSATEMRCGTHNAKGIGGGFILLHVIVDYLKLPPDEKICGRCCPNPGHTALHELLHVDCKVLHPGNPEFCEHYPDHPSSEEYDECATALQSCLFSWPSKTCVAKFEECRDGLFR